MLPKRLFEWNGAPPLHPCYKFFANALGVWCATPTCVDLYHQYFLPFSSPLVWVGHFSTNLLLYTQITKKSIVKWVAVVDTLLSELFVSILEKKLNKFDDDDNDNEGHYYHPNNKAPTGSERRKRWSLSTEFLLRAMLVEHSGYSFWWIGKERTNSILF